MTPGEIVLLTLALLWLALTFVLPAVARRRPHRAAPLDPERVRQMVREMAMQPMRPASLQEMQDYLDYLRETMKPQPMREPGLFVEGASDADIVRTLIAVSR